MLLLSLHNQLPPHAFVQTDLWNQIKPLPAVQRLHPGSQALLERLLLRTSGVDTRYFCSQDLAELFSADAEGLNHRFEINAPALAASSLRPALNKAGLGAQDLDALLVCTCTGYLCPGLSSYLAEVVGCRADCQLLDLVGLGCGAAIPMLRQAAHIIGSQPRAKVACVAVEVCSDALFLDNDAGVLISAALFADGASASIWGGEHSEASCSQDGRRVRVEADNFSTLHLPEFRECLRFVNDRGALRNRLAPEVPERAAMAVRHLLSSPRWSEGDALLIHPGGRRVIDAVQKLFPEQNFSISRSVLREFGNMSSPSILFCLERALNNPDCAPRIQLCSFGAGFSAHHCVVKISE